MDWSKIFKGFLIAAVGAMLTYGTEALPSIDLGSFTPIVVAGWSVLVNVVRKWLEALAAARG